MAHQLFQLPQQIPLSSNLTLLSGAKAYFYVTGTTTPQDVYTTSALSTPHTNPVEADGDGVFPAIYLDPTKVYKCHIKTSADVEVWPAQDPCNDQFLSQAYVGSVLYPQTTAELAAGVTPTNYAYEPGHALRYGTNTTPGTTDMAAAIQDALNAGYNAYLPGPGVIYAIGSTVRFKFAGQMIYGDGMGDTNTASPLNPRTTIKWIGSANSKMISVYPGTGASNLSECEIRDLLLDGNALANKGVEGYDDTITGGSWRTKLSRVAIIGVSNGSNPTCVYLGATGSAPDFAHDTQFDGCFLSDAARGVWGKGAKYSFINTTIRGMSGAGCYGESGSAWAFGSGCIFSQNARDFDGSNISQADFSGVWLEDSTAGIYRAATAHNASFTGCYLHTAYATLLMDMGNAAGNFSLNNCHLPASIGSTLVKNINSTAEYSIVGTPCTIDTGYRARYQGCIRADQAAFAAGITSDASNVTGDGTVYSLNSVAFTESYDLSTAFNAASGVFTAPLNGYYTFNLLMSLGQLASGHTDAKLELVTTSQTYEVARINPGAAMNASNVLQLAGSVTVLMAATDTAYMRITVSGGALAVDVLSGGTATNWRTRFEGRMM